MNNNLGEFIKFKRNTKGLTTKQIADYLKVNEEIINKLESGEIAESDFAWQLIERIRKVIDIQTWEFQHLILIAIMLKRTIHMMNLIIY